MIQSSFPWSIEVFQSVLFSLVVGCELFSFQKKDLILNVYRPMYSTKSLFLNRCNQRMKWSTQLAEYRKGNYECECPLTISFETFWWNALFHSTWLSIYARPRFQAEIHQLDLQFRFGESKPTKFKFTLMISNSRNPTSFLSTRILLILSTSIISVDPVEATLVFSFTCQVSFGSVHSNVKKTVASKNSSCRFTSLIAFNCR